MFKLGFEFHFLSKSPVTLCNLCNTLSPHVTSDLSYLINKIMLSPKNSEGEKHLVFNS